MNEKRLKMGLRRLANEGYFAVSVTDELVESLVRWCAPPSDEVKQRFLAKFRACLQDAVLDGASRPMSKQRPPHTGRGM